MSGRYVPHPDPEGVLADCEQRALEREGIPMFLALEDLTGRFPGARDRADGPELDRITGHYAERLRPGADAGAWFPVITRFIDCPVPEQRAFADAHDIDLVEEELGAERLAMTWDQVARIAERHLVIPHTGSHEQISKVVTPADIEREIFAPRRAVEKVTGREAPGFVWLYGSPFGTGPEQDRAVLDAGYRYQISNTMIQRIA